MTRRGNREGTIHQRPNGSWRVELRWVDRAGREQRTTRTTKTRADAARALKELRALAESGGSAGERMITVDAYWQRWRVGPLRAGDRKPGTVELYTGVMRTHVLPAVGNMRLSRLTAGDVEAMLAGMVRVRDSKHGRVGEPVSGQVRRTAFTVLSLMLTTAVRDGVVPRNVCQDLDRPKIDTPEADYLTPGQLGEVLAALSGHRLEPLIVLLSCTGMRIGEALAVRWDDLDLPERRLRITGTVGVVGGTVQRTPPKSLRGRRSPPLSPDVVDLLLAWRKVQLTERMRAGTSWEGTAAGYVFTTETGRLLDQRNASRAYARALKRAGLGTVPARFHIIRHSVASMMLVDGAVSVRTASEVLGHATTSITADIYGHVAEQAKTHALEVVAGALRTTASGTA